MDKKKGSPILLIAAICLVTLAVISLIGGLAYPQSTLMALTSFSRTGLSSRQFTPPVGQDGTTNNGGPGMGSGGTFSGGPGMGNRGSFSGTPEAGRQGQFNPNNQNGTIPNRQFGTNSRSVFSWLLPAGLGLSMLLAIISAIFLIRKKKWAGILALVISFLTIIVNSLALYSQVAFARFARMGNQVSLVFTIIEILLALAVIVLLLLPKSRALWAMKIPKLKPDDTEDDTEDDDNDSDEIVNPLRTSETIVEVAKTQPQITNRKNNPISTSALRQKEIVSAKKEEDDEDDED